MFDANQFKRSVKEWIRSHPNGSELELMDFCEEQIPPTQYASYEWLVDHTMSWFRHILAQRVQGRVGFNETEDESLA